MKRTALKRVSPRRAKKLAEAIRLDRDGQNMTIADVAKWLPKGPTRDWPKHEDVDSEEMAATMHSCFGRSECWLCGLRTGLYGTLDVHHIVSRSDERCNMVMLCRTCHQKVQHSPKMLPAVLKAKITHDRAYSSFLRIAQLRRKHYLFMSLDE